MAQNVVTPEAITKLNTSLGLIANTNSGNTYNHYSGVQIQRGKKKMIFDSFKYLKSKNLLSKKKSYQLKIPKLYNLFLKIIF